MQYLLHYEENTLTEIANLQSKGKDLYQEPLNAFLQKHSKRLTEPDLKEYGFLIGLSKSRFFSSIFLAKKKDRKASLEEYMSIRYALNSDYFFQKELPLLRTVLTAIKQKMR